MSDDGQGSPQRSPGRKFASIPKRRRGHHFDGEDSYAPNHHASRHLTPSELTKAAEELLDHYDHPDRARKLSGAGKGDALGILTPGNSSSTLALDSAHIHESAWSNIADHDCAKEGCFDSGSRSLPEDDRLSDDYTTRGGGKKRKVPASAQQGQPSAGGRDDHGHFGVESTCEHSCEHTCEHACEHQEDQAADAEAALDAHDQGCSHDDCYDCHPGEDDGGGGAERNFPVRPAKRKVTSARKALAFQKRLLDSRKAQILGLHGDASVCLAQTKQQSSSLPTREELESLTRALEYAGVSGWEGDRVGIGAGIWEGQTPRAKSKMLNAIQSTLMGTKLQDIEAEEESHDQPMIKLSWRRRGRALQRWQWLHREPVPRKGWIPEGSFEFEQRSSVSNVLSKSLQDLNLLRNKVTQLLTLTLNSRPMTNLLMANKTTPTTSTTPIPTIPIQKSLHHPESKTPNSSVAKHDGVANGKVNGKAGTMPQSASTASSTVAPQAGKGVGPGKPNETTQDPLARARADIKRIIDKVVETINSDPDPAMFEARLRERPGLDTKFSFLWEKDPNYPYFRYMVDTTRKRSPSSAATQGTARALPVAAANGTVPRPAQPMARTTGALAEGAPALVASPATVPAKSLQIQPPNAATKATTPAAAPATTPAASTPAAATAAKKVNTNPDVKIEASFTEPDYVAPPSNKKKPKKKKKTSFANASNPHHVKNYVPSRRPATTSNDPMDIPDLLEMMFFPPATRFLAARPPGLLGSNDADYRIASGGGEGGDPADDEYVCCFCEYDLFFGSKDLMEKGVNRRRKLLEKRNRVSEKAKGVLEGKGLGKLKSSNSAAPKKSAAPKEPYKGEEGCPGGDQCRCNEIRAEKAAVAGTSPDPEQHGAKGLKAEIMNADGEVTATGTVSAVYPPGSYDMVEREDIEDASEQTPKDEEELDTNPSDRSENGSAEDDQSCQDNVEDEQSDPNIHGPAGETGLVDRRHGTAPDDAIEYPEADEDQVKDEDVTFVPRKITLQLKGNGWQENRKPEAILPGGYASESPNAGTAASSGSVGDDADPWAGVDMDAVD